jgi:Ca-activated chloride channel homolog
MREASLKKIAGVFVILFLSLSAVAQNVPPILVTEGDKGSERLSLSKVAVEVEIHGFLAETRMTMTFRNPSNRPLAGDLYFPLPEGATISGYALDIKGVMVDGVVIEKEKGRIVFEKIVRQGIDPGLVEWVKGNNFRTRVFPIPAGGSRTVMVRYLSELDVKDKTALYRLPLNFPGKVDEFSLRIEVIKALAKPVVQAGGPEGLQFNRWRESYVAQTSLKNASLAADMVVALPDIEKQKVMVEKGPDGDYTFIIHDVRPEAGQKEREGSSTIPGRITVLWDNSGSRGRVPHEKELKILRDYFEQKAGKAISVDLIFFSNEKTKARSFKLEKGRAQALLEAIEKTEYDGGTQMAAAAPWKGDPPPDFYLLFTDGLSNFGGDDPGDFNAPVYIFSGDAQANHVYLRSLAQRTGGEYFNLAAVDEKTAVSRIGMNPFSFLSAVCESGTITDVYPRTPQPVQESFVLAGKLQSEKADIVLNYGRKNKGLQKSKFALSKGEAAEGRLLRLFWAQTKIDDLLVFQEKNREALLDMGRKFGLVTPATSLIVLDGLSQYVEHEIVPPESLPEMRKEYWKIIEQKKKDAWKNQQDKLERIVKLWQGKVAWWNRDFTYPDGFKFKEKKEAAAAVAGAVRAKISAEDRAPAEKMERRDIAPPPAPAKAAGKAESEQAVGMGEPAISIKEWNPETPYMNALRKAPQNTRIAVYLEQKKAHGDSPAFFLDCADFFFKNGQKDIGLRILSNIAEMELENAQLLRVLGHRLAQLEFLDLSVMIFEEVLKLRPEEPQSYRDLGLVLAGLKNYKRAVDLLYQVVLKEWDRFQEIELVALVEINNIITKAGREGIKGFAIDPRLVKLFDVDIRIVLTWDTDLTDMDLWVIEPSGEKAFFSNRLTTIGGAVSVDFTEGYGPEEYLLRKGMHGVYKIQSNYYGSRAQALVGAVTLQAEIFTNYGRPNEKRKAITLRLTEKQEVITVGEIEF